MKQLRVSLQHCRSFLLPSAEAVESSCDCGLELPVGLIKSGTVLATTLSGLGSHLNASSALSSPEMARFLLLRAEQGFDRAFEVCSADGEGGEAFCRSWDQAQADLANGALATFDDLVAMVCKARRGWLATPRELLVVMVDCKRVESALVPTSWFLS